MSSFHLQIVTPDGLFYDGEAESISVRGDKSGIGDDAVSVVTGTATVYIPLEELVDKEKEIARLTAESRKMDAEIARCEGMLNNPGFVSRAPEAKIQEEKAKLEKYEQMMAQVMERLNQLKK